MPPQILRDSKQGRALLPKKGCPSSGQNRNPSVVFLWSNEKSPQFSLRRFPVLVDLIGIEPTTLRMRTSTRNFFRVFPAVFSCFPSAPLPLWASLTMLFPCGPERCVVGSVVRNAPQPLPVSFADRDGERFCAFDCLHCTSVGRIKQVISAPSTAQELRDCKQK